MNSCIGSSALKILMQWIHDLLKQEARLEEFQKAPYHLAVLIGHS